MNVLLGFIIFCTEIHIAVSEPSLFCLHVSSKHVSVWKGYTLFYSLYTCYIYYLYAIETFPGYVTLRH